MKDYINGRNYWAVTTQREGQPIEAEKDGALPEMAINNNYLGNVLKVLFSKQLAEKPYEAPPEAFKPELGICLVGLEFAGKKTVAEQLSKKYSLHVIQLSSIIQERLSSFATLSEVS